MDDTVFPCLKLAATLPDDKRALFVLHIAKAIHATEEAVRMFFLVKSLPGNPLFKNRDIETGLFEDHFAAYEPPSCTELLKEFPEAYSKICCLCKYSPMFSNDRLETEQAVLSALLFDPSPENMRAVLPLKPSHFRCHFAFIAGSKLYVSPLYQVFFRFLRGSSSLTIPDNPLLDNLDTPNWQRIIHAFLSSTAFKKTVDPHMAITARDELILAISEELSKLNPDSRIQAALDEPMVRELMKRRKYSPLSFHDSPKKQAPVPVSKSPVKPAPSPAPPIILGQDMAAALAGTGLDKNISEGLITPLELPKYPEKEEAVPPPLPASSPALLKEDIPEPSFLDSDGWYDISSLYQDHQVIPFSDEMVRDYLYDSYIRQGCCLDCAYNQGEPGLLVYIPGHGALAWGTADRMAFLLKCILSDREIQSICWNMPEVIALCGKHGLENFSGLHSLTAVFHAATDTASLFPTDELLTLCQSVLDTKSPDFLLRYLPQYPVLYRQLLPDALKKSGARGIRIWHHYETALASSIYLQPHFALQQRNLHRTGLLENVYQYHGKIRKLTAGTVLKVTLVPGQESELPRFHKDQKLIMNILSSLFLTRELTSCGLRLLCQNEQSLTMFVSAKDRHALACIEELMSQVIARKFKDAHYAPPELIWSR